ncbi:universal stress protein [Bordetella genomosp. 13]|uniref:Universal stress protein n=1 Tax=Bordetella genomosp. 13 TaxID=463040 RepID=A0A1W6ZAE4_9BORD|nr:universal stress protein [Bordetella genomosp. 13]ARP94222.1 universal stress protein [Bordetella genomosp. 13]
MPKILVPVDGSECAHRALQEALRLTPNGEGVEIHLLNVQPPVVSGHARMFLDKSELQSYYEDEAREPLQRAKAALGSASVPHTEAVRAGHAGETIAEYAKEHHCDYIVMGTRGLGEVAGMLMGSVARKVIHAATVPVMLVK